MKKESAITLIALVITIVVLLILAGVSISMLTGENGIITKAQESKEENRGGAVEERRDLWVANINLDENINSQTAQGLSELLAELKEEGLLSDDEIAYINENGYIQIGSHFIDFRLDNSNEIDWSKLEPGLYETGTRNMIKSWEELKNEGYILVENSRLSQFLLRGEMNGDLIISEEINELGALANNPCNYYNDVEITGVYVPGTIKEIADFAFCDFSSLKNIVLQEGLKKIGYQSFRECVSLTSINIPNSVTSIESIAFSGCSSLTNITIPEGITSIGKETFSYCSSLTNITIPESVISIETDAFIGCSSLTKISVDINNQYYDSRNNCNAIIEKNTNALILGCKNTIIPEGATSIGENAFNGCSSLINITIPNSATNIGDYAFSECSSLTNITLPDSITSIGENAFNECSSLTNITLPDSITSIGENAFSECSSLTNITLPDSITSIGRATFSECSSLTNITLPDRVTSIERDAFSGCSSLTNMTIPESVTSIGTSAFFGCSNLTTVNYTGTKSQWNTITIINYENKDLTNATIHCTDGDI